MADIFISYASEDRERAREVASALEVRGWSVWWDRKIMAGESFDQAIERELETAKCVVVLWSKDSVISEWVKNEAATAAERGVLVPALIDNVKLPLEFRRKQTTNLTEWGGGVSDEGFQALCDGVAAKVSGTAAMQHQPMVPPRRGFRWRVHWMAGGVIAVAMAGLLILLLQPGVFINKSPEVGGGQDGPASALGVAELESRLKAVNINLSTGTEDDAARVRGYFTGPSSAYHLLAVNSLQVLGNRRLKETGYLDMIDKWYTMLVGEKHYVTANGSLDHEKLKEALVRANNEYHGQDATSFEQLVELLP